MNDININIISLQNQHIHPPTCWGLSISSTNVKLSVCNIICIPITIVVINSQPIGLDWAGFNVSTNTV